MEVVVRICIYIYKYSYIHTDTYVHKNMCIYNITQIHFHKCILSAIIFDGCLDNCRKPSTKPICIHAKKSLCLTATTTLVAGAYFHQTFQVPKMEVLTYISSM